jgi:hypothetical protein
MMLGCYKHHEAQGYWTLIRTPQGYWTLIRTHKSKELDAARAALDPDGQKERRAKALSDLAEMDADLLDIDPEMKP